MKSPRPLTQLLPGLIAAAALFSSTAPVFASDSTFTVYPDKPKQTIRGIGFEIQSDSIASGNQGLPEEPIAIPHDLVPSERERLANEMLKGFRYCRLAGGLYWRGLDAEQKQLQPRWPEQLQELKQLLDRAGVEGLDDGIAKRALRRSQQLLNLLVQGFTQLRESLYGHGKSSAWV